MHHNEQQNKNIMNISFRFLTETAGQSFVPGRKTREFINNKIKAGMTYIFIDGKKDNGVEWELCESLGINPANYVGRIEFVAMVVTNLDRDFNPASYDVTICVNKVA